MNGGFVNDGYLVVYSLLFKKFSFVFEVVYKIIQFDTQNIDFFLKFFKFICFYQITIIK